MAMMWLATANHCFVVEAFAKPAEPIHHCCPQSGTKPDPSGPHEKNSDKACCQLFVKDTSAQRDLAVPTAAPTPILLPVISLAFDVALVAEHVSNIFSFALGPPGNLEQVLLSLTLAPNAPPASL